MALAPRKALEAPRGVLLLGVTCSSRIKWRGSIKCARISPPGRLKGIVGIGWLDVPGGDPGMLAFMAQKIVLGLLRQLPDGSRTPLLFRLPVAPPPPRVPSVNNADAGGATVLSPNKTAESAEAACSWRQVHPQLLAWGLEFADLIDVLRSAA